MLGQEAAQGARYHPRDDVQVTFELTVVGNALGGGDGVLAATALSGHAGIYHGAFDSVPDSG